MTAEDNSKIQGENRYIRDVHRAWEKKSSDLHYGGSETRPYPHLDLPKEWESFSQTPFPSAARGQEVDGVDLAQLRSDAAGCIQQYLDSGSANMDVLEKCLNDLRRIFPLLVGDTAAYFQRLLDCSEEVQGRIVDI